MGSERRTHGKVLHRPLTATEAKRWREQMTDRAVRQASQSYPGFESKALLSAWLVLPQANQEAFQRIRAGFQEFSRRAI
jgi:hypothetical protein